MNAIHKPSPARARHSWRSADSKRAKAIYRLAALAHPCASYAARKKAINAKAKKLGLPVAELMRRGAVAYNSAEAEEELGALADAAIAAANRAADSIDEVLSFVEESDKRIAAMEEKAAKARKTA